MALRLLKNSFDHPPDPLPFGKLRTGLARKGGIISGGHPQTPGKGASPHCTPFFISLTLDPLLDRGNQVGYGAAHCLGAHRFGAGARDVGGPVSLGDGLVHCLLHHLRLPWEAQGEAEHHGR